MTNTDKVLCFLQENMAFSVKGFIIFLLPMLPNFIFFALPNSNSSNATVNTHFALDIIEHGSQALFFMLLIFTLNKKVSPLLCKYTILMAVFLLCYYGCWIVYFTRGANSILIMLMAIFPVIYFSLSIIWLNSVLAIAPLAIFAVSHILITYIDYAK